MNAARTRAMIFLRELDIIKSCFSVMNLLCLMMIVAATLHAATMAEVTAQLATLNAQQKRDFLVKGAQAERHSPHPHAAILFAEWALSEEAQSFLAATLGKGTAMKGVKSKYQEFQVQPDYVVTPKLGPKLNDYLKEFRQIMGIQ